MPCEYFSHIKASICSSQLVIGKESKAFASMLPRVLVICIPLKTPADASTFTWLQNDQRNSEL